MKIFNFFFLLLVWNFSYSQVFELTSVDCSTMKLDFHKPLGVGTTFLVEKQIQDNIFHIEHRLRITNISETETSFTVANNGIYRVTAIRDQICNVRDYKIWKPSRSISNILYHECARIGKRSNISDNDFSIYPNPAKEKIHIRFDAEPLQWYFEIYDINGKLVKKGNNASEINCSDLYGVFIMRLHFNETIVSKMFSVNN